MMRTNSSRKERISSFGPVKKAEDEDFIRYLTNMKKQRVVE